MGVEAVEALRELIAVADWATHRARYHQQLRFLLFQLYNFFPSDLRSPFPSDSTNEQV